MDASTFTRKIGPLPAWAWGALVVMVAYGVYAFRGTGDTDEGIASDQGFYTEENDTTNPAYVDAGDITGTPQMPPRTAPTPESNPQWLRLVVDNLVAEGTLNPTIVHAALQKVLNGLPINEQEEAIWNKAVRLYGQPPESYPPIEVIRTGTPTEPTSPSVPSNPYSAPSQTTPVVKQQGGTWVTVVKYTSKSPAWNSTISGIARQYGWGSNWQGVWNHSENSALRNRTKNNPRLIRPGDRVYVPKK